MIKIKISVKDYIKIVWVINLNKPDAEMLYRTNRVIKMKISFQHNFRHYLQLVGLQNYLCFEEKLIV